MPETVKKIASLLVKYWRQELEEDELNELLDWANHSPANKEAFARLTDPDFMVDHLRELALVKQEIRQRIWAEMQFSGEEWQEPKLATESDNRKFNWRSSSSMIRMAAAGLLVVTGILYFFYRPATRNLMKSAEINLSEPVHHPEKLSTNSLVRFTDGKIFNATTMANGTAIEHGPLKLEKKAGGIRVSTATAIRDADSTSFTTITTPESERLTVWLPDGTEVMLNVASWLRFPALFSRQGRTVEASGELYFQVAPQNFHGAPVPFLVQTSGMNLEAPVAGFNVQVYPNNQLARATLASGTLRVWKQVLHAGSISNSRDKVDVLLEPGQQAQVSNQAGGADMGGIRVEHVNPEEVVKWKNQLPAK